MGLMQPSATFCLLSLLETYAINVEPDFTPTRQKTEYLSNWVNTQLFLHKLNVA